jgi:uncharacterized membrane protein
MAQRGFSLLASAICAGTMFGALGLGVDIARVNVIRNEAQGYADAAALSAALRLDGTAAGLSRAIETVGASPNKWNFGRTSFTGTLVEFSSDGSTGWATSISTDPAHMKYVRVTAIVNDAPILLLPLINTAQSTDVKAFAVAGRVPEPAAGPTVRLATLSLTARAR